MTNVSDEQQAQAISARSNAIKPSPTLAITQKAAELKAAGRDVISMGAGEPDFDTPEHIKAAAISAITAGKTKYTAVDGTPELKAAIAAKFKRDNQLTLEMNQILVSNGGKQSFFNLAMALLNPGDEVIVPAPYWVSYPDMIKVAEGVPVILKADHTQHFKVTAEQLEAAITPRTKLFVINSPSNPTGVAYNKEELAQFAEVLRRHPHVFIATDDMYEHILWSDTPFCNITMAAPDLTPRTFSLNGVSKCYSMTGWRIGYCAGPAPIIAAMKKIQSQSTSGACSVSQAAATAALNESQECISTMLSAFKKRHDLINTLLNDLPGNITCLPSDGTFYAFPYVGDCIDALTGINTDIDFASWILEAANVAIVPGSAFGTPGYARLSFACSEQVIETALSRIKAVLNAKLS